jgi:hypothetical protein
LRAEWQAQGQQGSFEGWLVWKVAQG